MPTKVILRPGVNVTANTLINFEGARVFAEEDLVVVLIMD